MKDASGHEHGADGRFGSGGGGSGKGKKRNPEHADEGEEKEPSILDIINQRNEQAAALRGKVPSMARTAANEAGHGPTMDVVTRRNAERASRERIIPKKPATERAHLVDDDPEPSILDIINQRNTQAESMRGKINIPKKPQERLATLTIPGKPRR